MQVFDLIPLADDAGADKVLDGDAGTGHMEVAAESMKCSLDAFMVVIVRRYEDGRRLGERGRHIQAVVEGHQSVHDAPRFP